MNLAAFLWAVTLAGPAATYETVVTDGHDLPPAAPLRTFKRKDLDGQGARTVADALAWEPRLNVSTGSRGERIFTLRGFDQRQSAVLVDGFPESIPYDGQVDLNMFPTAMVERVSVMGGAGPSSSGPVGLGGAVTVQTRRAGMGPFLESRLECSPFGSGSGNLFHANRVGSLGYTVFGGGDFSNAFPLSESYRPTSRQPDGWRLNSDRKAFHVGGAAQWKVGGNAFTADARYVDGARGVPPSDIDDSVRFWRFNAWRNLAASVGHSLDLQNVHSNAALVVRKYDNLLDSYDDGSYSAQSSPRAFHTWYHDLTVGPRWRGEARATLDERLSLTAHAYGLGGYERHEDNSGNRAAGRVFGSAAVDTTVDWRDVAAFSVGAQWDSEVPVDLPGEHSHVFLGVGPQASLRVQVLPGVQVTAATGRRVRFPTLRERFSRALGFTQPNPDLKPEAAWHTEFRAAVHPVPSVWLEGGVFDAEVDGLMERVALGNGLNQMQNTGAARLYGVDVGGRARLGPWATVHTSYALLQAQVLATTGPRELAYRPTHKVVMGLLLTPHPLVACGALLRVVGPQRYQNPNTLNWGTLSPYTVVDAHAELAPLPWVHVEARATNLLDAAYQSEFGFPNPGRQVWLGLRLGAERPPVLDEIAAAIPGLT